MLCCLRARSSSEGCDCDEKMAEVEVAAAQMAGEAVNATVKWSNVLSRGSVREVQANDRVPERSRDLGD